MNRYVPKLPPLDPCPVEHVFALVGGKWKARILHRLTLSDASIADLRRHLGRVSSQVLKVQLSAMETDGLIRRRQPDTGRMWGDYAITKRGRSVHHALAGLVEWGADDLGGWVAPTRAA